MLMLTKVRPVSERSRAGVPGYDHLRWLHVVTDMTLPSGIMILGDEEERVGVHAREHPIKQLSHGLP